MKPVTVRKRKLDWQERMDTINARNNVATNDDGFTVREYAERYGLSRDGADGRLGKLERRGEIVRGWAIRNGTRAKVYRFPDATR